MGKLESGLMTDQTDPSGRFHVSTDMQAALINEGEDGGAFWDKPTHHLRLAETILINSASAANYKPGTNMDIWPLLRPIL